MNIKNFLCIHFCDSEAEAKDLIDKSRIMVNSTALTDDEYEVRPGDIVKRFVVHKAVLVKEKDLEAFNAQT